MRDGLDIECDPLLSPSPIAFSVLVTLPMTLFSQLIKLDHVPCESVSTFYTGLEISVF